MKTLWRYHEKIVMFLIAIVLFLAISSVASWGQEEVTSRIYRYRERVATGYYEGYEVSPRRARAKVEIPGTGRGLFPFGRSSSAVRIRSRLPDSHRGLRFYERNTCVECHPREARNIHSTRAAISCRQCHGPEPIASIKHYFSPMNPIRRHAYICSKCHENANVNFAGFYVHEPPSGSLETRKTFPLLFYTSWGMLLLLLGTLAFFVPHSAMVGLRELSETRVFEILHKPMVILKNRMKRIGLIMAEYLMGGVKKVFQKKKGRADEENDVS